jgi:predicted alpha/beta superfamily hydrolase
MRPMTPWTDYADARAGAAHTVTGIVKVLAGVEGPEPGTRRDLLVHLPPSWPAAGRRWPVLYMQDGQNLFDASTSFAGEWGVDETMLALSAEGIEAIVVGVPNAGEARLDEYAPFRDPAHGGGGADAYLEFLVGGVRPLVDEAFPTLSGPEATGIAGSSMGGLLSLYALFRRPDVFGLCAAMSPALWFAGGAIHGFVASSPRVPGRVYLDTGTGEGRTERDRRRLRREGGDRLGPVARMHALLLEKGWADGVDLLYVEEPGGEHHEEAWRRRLPGALRFLLSGSGAGSRPG